MRASEVSRRVETRRRATDSIESSSFIEIIEIIARWIDARRRARMESPDAYLEFFLSLGVDFLAVRGVVGHDVEASNCDDDRASITIPRHSRAEHASESHRRLRHVQRDLQGRTFSRQNPRDGVEHRRSRAEWVLRWVTHSSSHRGVHVGARVEASRLDRCQDAARCFRRREHARCRSIARDEDD